MGQDPAEGWEVPDLREQALCDSLEPEGSGKSSGFSTEHHTTEFSNLSTKIVIIRGLSCALWDI